jgi:hypothetical protein
MKNNQECLTEDRLRQVLQFVLEENVAATKRNPDKVGIPVCIWGPHGIGKTEFVMDLAREKGWHFTYCAPGQFEEMGDFHGMPVVEPSPDGTRLTKTAPPDWVPREEGPGILLLDDINRADDRILRGLMQLLQCHRMGSWTLPSQWQIVATANPEDAGYSVTSMDDAMLTRMLHFSMRFDAKNWAAWATRKGVDARGIAFVLGYPETISGQRTTPRTLTQFFALISGIADLGKELSLVRHLATACLDPETVRAFCAFVCDDLSVLPGPEEILTATPKQRDAWKTKVERAAEGKSGVKRIDRLSTIVFRVLLHTTQPQFVADTTAAENFIELLQMRVIPRDLGIGQLPSLLKSSNSGLRKLLQRKDVEAQLGNQFVDELLEIQRVA